MRNETPQNLILMGLAYRELGKMDEALTCWRGALKLAPHVSEVRFNLLCGLHEANLRGTPEYESLLSSLIVKRDGYYLSGRSLDSRKLAATLERYGTALIRNFYDAEEANERGAHTRENLERGRQILGKYIPAEGGTLPVWFACPHRNDASFERRLEEAYNEKLFTLAKYSTPAESEDLSDFARRLIDNGLRSAIDSYLGYNQYTLQLDRSMARVWYADKTSYFGSHQDARLSKDWLHFVNLWVPFTSCGQRAPSLGFIPVRFFNYFPDIDEGGNILRDAFPPEVFHMPEFEPGDVLIMTSFTMHAFIKRSEMTEMRMSVDLRLM